MENDQPLGLHPVPIHIANPGFTRYGLEMETYVSIADQQMESLGYLRHTDRRPQGDAWAHLQWWESEIQAQRGIERLCARPFLWLSGHQPGQQLLVPTRQLYPQALTSKQTKKIKQAARHVVAAVRQARECYIAAASLGVTPLTTPILYFYGALALASAVVVAAHGIDALDHSHGLDMINGPSSRSLIDAEDSQNWPTLVRWQGSGMFASLYRATRWDALYSGDIRKRPESYWTTHTFHILECLRMLGCDWGALPEAIDRPNTIWGTRPIVHLLLPYIAGQDLYVMPHIDWERRTLIQVPRLLVQYMVLMYFADLARYHPIIWQRLLEGAEDLEGYPFRAAAERIPHEFVAEAATLLPLPDEQVVSPFPIHWSTNVPSIEEWYSPPMATVGTPTFSRQLYTLPEWREDRKFSDSHGDSNQANDQSE
jgi:hypothetical protein